MDQNDIRKVLTHKSGQFVFSARFDTEAVEKRLLEADVTRRVLRTLRVPPRILLRIEDEFFKRSIHGTAAAEGNTLNEEDVERILSSGDDFVPADNREMEIVNLKLAYGAWRDMARLLPDRQVTESLVQDIHRTIVTGISSQDNIPGQYRNIRVEVGDAVHGGKYVPPRILEDIKHVMAEFAAWVNAPPVMSLHPIPRAGLVHYHLGLIHPFRDGNGRVARLVEAYLLDAAGWHDVGLLLSRFYHQHMDEYYTAFTSSEKDKNHRVDCFINFVLDGVFDSLRYMEQTFSFQANRLVMRGFIAQLANEKRINARQRDLADILVDFNAAASIRNFYSQALFRPLYKDVSEQTARRDLKKLLGLGIIRESADGYRINI